MYVGNTVTTAHALSRGRNLKVATNFKAGAAASDPSLLNSEQTDVGNLKLRTHRIAGIDVSSSAHGRMAQANTNAIRRFSRWKNRFVSKGPCGFQHRSDSTRACEWRRVVWQLQRINGPRSGFGGGD